MKINKYFGLALASILMLSACQEVEDALQGGVVTAEQKSEVALDNPEKISSDMNALKDILIQFATISDSYHDDFGYPAACLKYDNAGQDMVSENVGYNWFSYQLIFNDRIKTSSDALFFWKLHHQHIKAANDILKMLVTDEAPEGEIANYIGQAYAARAFDYLQLVQTYQFTYIGHEDEYALPIITETMSDEEAMNNPLQTVSDVYTQIMNDLNTAIPLLENNPITCDKATLTAGAAYGLRARANLLMGNWKAAANDAASALEVSGATPYTIDEVSVPSFNEASANSWIWGNIITANNDVVMTGIVNWPSHLCSMTGNGYTTGIGISDCHKRINSNLWAKIPATDVRKGWWIDEKMASPLLVNAFGAGIAAQLPPVCSMAPYTNVKFGNQGDILDTENSEDWPIMRAEEMLLIQAEALGRVNLADGKAALEDFVKTYRDPAYTCQAADLNAFIDEIWFQRRVELWGEGFSLFDVLRLKKGIDRTNSNFSANVTYNLPAESPIFIYSIPEKEREANKGIDVNLLREDPVSPTPIM